MGVKAVVGGTAEVGAVVVAAALLPLPLLLPGCPSVAAASASPPRSAFVDVAGFVDVTGFDALSWGTGWGEFAGAEPCTGVEAASTPWRGNGPVFVCGAGVVGVFATGEALPVPSVLPVREVVTSPLPGELAEARSLAGVVEVVPAPAGE